MQRVSRLPLLFPIVAAAVLTFTVRQAQPQSVVGPTPPNALLSPFVAPVAHLPLTATFVLKVERPQANESAQSIGCTFQVARDATGRISRELRGLVPASSAEAPPLFGTVLYNPHSHMSQTIDPVHRTDVKLPMDLPTDIFTVSPPAETQGLGVKTIDGLKITGVRRTWKIPARLSPTGKRLQTVDERWYSKDLRMVVLERRFNLLGGVVRITLSAIDRGNPSASLFEAPTGYRVIVKKSLVNTSGGPPGDLLSIPSADSDPNLSGAW